MEDTDNQKILIEKIIYDVIEEHNKLNPIELHLEKSSKTNLLGKDGILDSLGFINFLIEVESSLQEKVSKNISIVDEKLFQDFNGPYKNIMTLKEFIFEKIN